MDWASVKRWLEAGVTAVLEQVAGGDDRVIVAPSSTPGRPTHDGIVVSPAPSIQIGPGGGNRRGSAVVVGPQASLVIEPIPRPVWDDLGWVERTIGSQRVYEGHYVVTHRGRQSRVAGRIVDRGGTIDAYVADPPAAIKRHRKGPCFQLVEAPWFKMHWHRPARTVDDAILYVQRILHEVLQ